MFEAEILRSSGFRQTAWMVEVGTGVTAGHCDTPDAFFVTLLPHLTRDWLWEIRYSRYSYKSGTIVNVLCDMPRPCDRHWLEIVYKLVCDCGDDQHPLSFTIPPSKAVTFSPS